MDKLLIFKTRYWEVTHRRDSRYSGYLMASSLFEGSDLSELPEGALLELGSVLSRSEAILMKAYSPYKVMVAKLGFSRGFHCHFHLIPATTTLLREIVEHPSYTDEPDGNDAILFVSREYCERDLTDNEKEEMEQAVERLREFV